MKQLALFTLDAQSLVLPDLDGCGFVRLESIDPTENRFRFYLISWQKTLWGEWATRSTWGQIGGMGRDQVAYLESQDALWETLLRMVTRRLARGYLLKWPRPGVGNGKLVPEAFLPGPLDSSSAAPTSENGVKSAFRYPQDAAV